MNLDEIRAMNPNDARKLPLEEMLKAVYEGQTSQVWTAREQDEHGNWLRQEWEDRSRYDGKLLATHKIVHSYWEPGVVKDIDVREFYDDDSPKSVLVTTQDKDGKEQPVVIERRIFAKPIAKPTEK